MPLLTGTKETATFNSGPTEAQLKRWTTNEIPDQTGRIALVTGANSGLGFETALELARHGATVVMACRNQRRCESAVEKIRGTVHGAKVETALLDLADLASVRRFAEEFGGRHHPLDLLINNAGVGAIPHRHTTAQGFELQMGTNHLGHFALTGLVLPLLGATPGARVVTVSSLAHRGVRSVGLDDLQSEHHYRSHRVYARTKLANAEFALELDRRLGAAGSHVLSVGAHPGLSATNLQITGPSYEGRTLTSELIRIGTRLAGTSASRGAEAQLYAATMPEVRGGDYFGPTLLYETRGPVGRVRYSRAAHDTEEARGLWDLSEQLTEVHYGLPGASG